MTRKDIRDRQQKKRGSALFIILLVVFIGVFLYAGYRMIGIISEWGQGTSTYSSVGKKYVEEGEDSRGAEINFVELKKDYPSTASWIRIEDTPVDYPVAHGDNNSYYLNHLIDGTHNKNGTIFIDYRNSEDYSDRNTILYGHHMKNGAMFGSLVKYRKQKYYEEHPIVLLYTPEQSWVGEIFSAYICPAGDEVYRLTFADDADFAEYLRSCRQSSAVSTKVEVTPADHIVTLSTCTYEYDNARFVVQAKLIPMEEYFGE